jgi:KDO2-lipid IV(A) lauroyltransferase
MNLSYLLYRLSGALVPRIPAAWGYGLCDWLGGVLYQVYKPGRANIQANLRRVLGSQTNQAEIDRRARATFKYILYNYFDLFRLPALDPSAVAQLVTVTGWEHVEAAMAQGRGLVMVSAHLGNIEVVLYAILLRGLAITIPVERLEPPELFDYICRLRMSHGLKLIPIDGSLLDLVRTLKKGGIAGLAGDRDITRTGQKVNFFGQPAHLPDGHVRLALKTGAPLVVGFGHRNPDHTYQAYFLPAFYPPPGASEAEQIAAGMRFIVAEMEKAIAQHPEQWTMTVPIWADPPDEPHAS